METAKEKGARKRARERERMRTDPEYAENVRAYFRARAARLRAADPDAAREKWRAWYRSRRDDPEFRARERERRRYDSPEKRERENARRRERSRLRGVKPRADIAKSKPVKTVPRVKPAPRVKPKPAPDPIATAVASLNRAPAVPRAPRATVRIRRGGKWVRVPVGDLPAVIVPPVAKQLDPAAERAWKIARAADAGSGW